MNVRLRNNIFLKVIVSNLTYPNGKGDELKNEVSNLPYRKFR